MKIRTLLLACLGTFLFACGGGGSYHHRLVKIETKGTGDLVSTRTTLQYNDSGLPIEMSTITNPDSFSGNDVPFPHVTNFKYNGLGQLIETSTNSWSYKKIHLYTESGRLVRSKTIQDIGGEDAVIGYEDYFYDQADRVIRWKRTTDNGFERQTLTLDYDYDHNDFVSKITESPGLENRLTVTTYSNTVDTNGRLISRVEEYTINDGTATLTRYYFYEEGPCVVPEPTSLRKHFCAN